MIKSFKHTGLKNVFETGRGAKVRPDLKKRCIERLDVIDGAEKLEEINVPGFNFHALQGKRQRYSVHVDGRWCITFEWEDDGNAFRVDLEQYH